MNALEALLEAIGKFNSDAQALDEDADVMKSRHTDILAQAKALGIPRPKAAAMLARIKCQVEPAKDAG